MTPKASIGWVLGLPFTRLLVLVVALLSSGAAFTAVEAPAEDTISRTLIVSFDPVLVPDAVDIAASHVSARSGEFFEVLQHPLAASRLLYRPATAVELRIAAIDPHAPEAMISKYIRVTYDRGVDLAAVAGIIVQDKRVRSVGRLSPPSFSSPTDPLFFSTGPLAERQYGMQTFNPVSNKGGLSFSTAWDLILGNAYVNVIDLGIEAPYDSIYQHAIHPDLSANFRQQFSRNTFNLAANYIKFGAVDESFEAASYVPPIAGFGHGTHVAGIIAAASSLSQTTNFPPPSVGVAGGCFNCSLLVTKLGIDPFNEIIIATDSGAQVINRSGPYYPQPTSCGLQQATCDAIARAYNRGVVFVAASGNNRTVIDFPANAVSNPIQAPSIPVGTPLAIAVGGSNTNGAFWIPSYPGAEPGSNSGPEQALIAPAENVVSTFYRGQTWNAVVRCADRLNSNTNLITPAFDIGYGDCNGTSMSAPHVSALAGLVKSADPLLNAAQARTVLVSSGSDWPTHYNDRGYGLPDAPKAVQKGLDGYGATDPISPAARVSSRLTPLFSLFSPKALDHFYTTVPQMAAAALDGTLKPQPMPQIYVGNVNVNHWPVCCTSIIGNPACSNYHYTCGGYPPNPVPLDAQGVSVREPDGVTMIGNMPVALLSNPSSPDPDHVLGGTTNMADLGMVSGNTSPFYAAVTSSASPGTIGQLTGTNLIFPPNETQGTLYAYPLNFMSLPYNVLDKDFPVDPNNPGWAPAIARKVPEYTAYPAYNYCAAPLHQCTNPYPHQPTASVRVFTSYKNPVAGGADLVPLYRLSFVCRDGPSIGACLSNPYHISHVYSTDPTEVFTGTMPTPGHAGYTLDGIEGYIFSKALGQPLGTVKLCRKYSQARDDFVLFPGAGSGGIDCGASAFEGGSYSQSETYLGYVYAVTSDNSKDARAHANIQTGVFRNTVSPPVSQFILDFDFNGTADNAVSFGSPGDKGLVADMNNDGRADLVTFRVSSGQGVWTADLDRDGIPPLNVYYFGGDPADQPIIGKMHSSTATSPDLAVYRNGIWYITFSPTNGSTGAVNQTCGFGGLAGDVPLVGDFNHDGIDDLVIYRSGIWYIHFMPSCGMPSSADMTLAFGGVSGDMPLVADWDRDGIADLIIFRSPGYWYVSTRRDGYAQVYAFGAPSAGDSPLAARFNQ